MGNEIPNGFGEATIEMDFISGPSNPMACVFGYINDGDQPPGLNAGFIRDAWNQWIGNTPFVGDNCQHLRTNVRQNPGGASGSATSGLAGTNGGFTLPPNVSFLVHKGTAQGGRTGRGRMYIPGVPQASSVEGGLLTAAWISDMNATLNSFKLDLGSVSLEMYLLHAEGSVLPAFEVTDLSVDPILATQRRRLR